jgi:pimeloyl-ACP methyl ester carboxylesterase
MPTPYSGFVNVKDGKLFYEALGNPKDLPVVLVHAGFLDRRMWDEQFELFASEGFRVIRYDMRGLGKSDKPVASYEDAADLKELLKRTDVESPASLIGVSNGGSTAIDFALEYPTQVKCLVLVAPTVNGYEFSDANYEKIWMSIDKENLDQENAIKEDRMKDAVEIQLNIVASALSPEGERRCSRSPWITPTFSRSLSRKCS